MSLQPLSADREADKEKIKALFYLAEESIKETDKLTAVVRGLARHAQGTDRQLRETDRQLRAASKETDERMRNLIQMAEQHELRFQDIDTLRQDTAEILRRLKPNGEVDKQS